MPELYCPHTLNGSALNPCYILHSFVKNPLTFIIFNDNLIGLLKLISICFYSDTDFRLITTKCSLMHKMVFFQSIALD